MGRIRTLKPEFFRSRSLSRVSIAARLTFQGLWCEADDFGRGVADPRIVKGAVWPLEDAMTWEAVADHLGELGTEHITLYEVEGEAYYEIVSWEEHQSAAYRRGKAQFPAPDTTESATPEPPEQESHDEPCETVQAARPVVLELGTGNGTGNGEQGTGIAPRGRARDPMWDAIVDCWQIAESELTDPERGRLNKACRLLRDVEADPGEIPRRRAIYRTRYRDAADTPMAIAGRWAELRSQNNGQAPKLPQNADSVQRAVARAGGKQ